jgi:hypothetical protein
MDRIDQSVAIRVALKAFLASDHIAPATGKTIAVVISKNGGAFGNPSAGATNATEISSGWYYVDLSATDTATAGPLIVRGTETDTDPVEIAFHVHGSVQIKKNQALAGFTFPMFGSTTHELVTGMTVTATRSIDGAAFGACANAVSEVGGGGYKLDLAAADLNGNVILLKFTATGADDQVVTIVTQP